MIKKVKTKWKVLKLAKRAGFDNVKKLKEQWKGHDVYCPCGPKGETLFIGPVYFVVMDENIVPYIGAGARRICADMEAEGVKKRVQQLKVVKDGG